MSTGTKPKEKSKKKRKGGKKIKFRRVVLKLSGEAVGTSEGIRRVAKEIIWLRKQDVEVIVVFGAGNIMRGGGVATKGLLRVLADEAGMTATVVNCINLEIELRTQGYERVHTRSARNMDPFAKLYNVRDATIALEQGYVVIVGGGTGNAFCTTDSAAALRACELDADVLLMAKSLPVEMEGGIYSANPQTDPDAYKLYTVDYDKVRDLEECGMDEEAILKCQAAGIPILVYHGRRKGELKRVLANPSRGTLIAA